MSKDNTEVPSHNELLVLCDFECRRMNNGNSLHMFCIGGPIALFIALVE